MPQPVQVKTSKGVEEWLIDVSRPDDRVWNLSLTGGDQTWSASGLSIFRALRTLMSDLDSDDILIGVNGARPNAWASGMLADAGGSMVYLCEMGHRDERPTCVNTLGAAPLQSVGCVAEQDQFHTAWLASRD